MKYFKTKFTVKSLNGDKLPDETTLSTARELCAALAGYAGYESFEDNPEGIDGYVQQYLYDENSLNASFADFPMEGIRVSCSTSEAEDKNWNEEWEKEGFEPIAIGARCCIHDIYHEVTDHYPIDIEIDARQAFGTGTHNTTIMIVGKLLDMDLKGKRVLDCGCGTGILSIVASICGANSVVAYDIDEWSVDNTKHNAAINKTENIDVRLGDVKVLDDITGTFDIVLANINRNILLADMSKMREKMKSGTIFIISGFYSEDVPMLREKAEALGLEFIEKESLDDWTMLVFENR